MKRLRLHYAKRGPLCFVPHVELPPLFCRAARRAGLLPALTEGMAPHPRVVLGPPLPMGVVGLDEPADFWFDEADDEALSLWPRFFPRGLDVKGVEEIAEGPGLSRLCQAAAHRVLLRRFPSEEALEPLLVRHYGEALLAFSRERGGFSATLADPNQNGPGSLVKALVEAGLLEGWADLLIVRTAVGTWDGKTLSALRARR
ncbi:TIGR03936 family radical SAM-associated protein [Aminithiophilus ramosus]|uniref:TIGR03936 family radical SAM-associated protein n=2 Tax=Synergistales TaxID=649776 RepID=A0A9Q7AM84_9BACT|nr:TIGR03936 family radical SAM-associated protein [Aminithiophilus ramosus]QTX31547.1 TIGR03936 family radical SAM-associated protein [Aminithiophilus ramosus]QVL35354.1 TIGR03936 family radical SAM-associated protein [Synergistota bacterium]